MQHTQFMESPETLGIDPEKLDGLMSRVRQEVDEGLLPAVQVAVARQGRLALFESYGDATSDSLFCIFSATKAITSAAAWLLIQEGRLDISGKVADLIPEFAPNDKQDITIEQLFLHTAGFPHAPFRVEDWPDKARRYERFSSWRLNWAPGSRYEYHPTSSMWIIAELIERLSGQTYQDFVRQQIALPLGLDDLWVGTPESEHERIARIVHVGEALTPSDYEKLGLPVPPETEVSEAIVENFNRRDNRLIPVPGGGGITSAADMALFYQSLIGTPAAGNSPWTPETIAFATQPRTGGLTDMNTGVPVNRGLGVVISGDSQRNQRGFGHTNSPRAFGHEGVGGQVAWIDPATGISFCYLTSGHDRNALRYARRGVSLSNRAAACLAALESA